jgi:hypothetical protein
MRYAQDKRDHMAQGKFYEGFRVAIGLLNWRTGPCPSPSAQMVELLRANELPGHTHQGGFLYHEP